MMSQDENITQKDLLKLLVDQAQHSATPEELNRVEDKLIKRIDVLEEKNSSSVLMLLKKK